MLANIRKHQGWLWVIIAVVVIAFVLWGSQMNKYGGAGGGGASGYFGNVLGRPVSQEEYVEARNEARLRYFFNAGTWPEQDKRGKWDEQKETYLRLLAIREIEDLGIHVSNESVGEIATARIQQLTQGRSVPLEDFVKRVLAPAGIDQDDFARFLHHEIGFEQLIALVGAGGRMITPEEIRSLYQREHEDVSVQAVFFDASNYLANVSVSTPAFMQYYTNEMPRYHLPERVQVNYVRFSSSNFITEATHEMDEVTNLDDVLTDNLEKLGPDFDPTAKTPEEKKAKLRQLMLDQKALQAAYKKANEFASALGDMEPKQGDLALLAQTNGLKVHLSPPFDRDTPPDEFNVGADFSQHAFELGPDGWFYGPIRGQDAVYVVELAKRLPDENPPFDEVRNRVLADYKFGQALMLARLYGGRFEQSITNSVNHGKSFAAICAEAGLRPDYLPPFSISSTNGSLPAVEERVTLNRFKEVVFGLPVGQVSPFVPDDGGGFMVYVHSKLPINETAMDADYPRFAAMVQQNRSYEAFNAWFNREVMKGLRDTPWFQSIQQQQQQQRQPAAASGGPSPQN